MPEPTNEELAALIVADFIEDFSDRRGFRNNWDMLDDDIREEIVQEWNRLAAARLSALLQAVPREVTFDAPENQLDYASICMKCGQFAGDRPSMKYCGDGSDKDNAHRYERTPPKLRTRMRVLAILAGYDAHGPKEQTECPKN